MPVVKVAGVLTHRDSVQCFMVKVTYCLVVGTRVLAHGEASSVLTCECECPAVTPVVRVSWVTLVSWCECFYLFPPIVSAMSIIWPDQNNQTYLVWSEKLRRATLSPWCLSSGSLDRWFSAFLLL